MINKLSEALLILASLCILGLLLSTSLQRLEYPYDLEWMEGGMLIHAWRVMEGKGLYVEPSSDFIPYIYPPLYSWVMAGLAQYTELTYSLGRGLSLAGSILAGLALITALREENASWGLSFLGAALFWSAYEDTGAFFDLTRADGCFLGVLAWALVAVRKGYIRLGGVLLCISFLFKHNAAILGFPCVFWLYRREGIAVALSFAMWSAIPALSMVCWLQWSTDGLFLDYILKVASNHPIVGYRLVWLSFAEIVSSMALLAIVAAGWFALWGWRRGYKKRMIVWGVAVLYAIALSQIELRDFPKIMNSAKNGVVPFALILWVFVGIALFRIRISLSYAAGFWIINGLVAIAFSALMRGHHGGYTNVLMPGCWMFAMWMVLVLKNTRLPVGVIAVLGAGQLYLGKWQPEEFIPTDADRQAGDDIVAQLRELPGPIFAPHSPWLPVQAGHLPTTHLIAIWDIDHKNGVFSSYMTSIKNDFAQTRWNTIVSASAQSKYGRKKYYRTLRKIQYKDRRTFIPKTGWRVRPTYIFVPKTQKQLK